MTISAKMSLVHRPNTLLAILWGGLACGTLDITAALVIYGTFGARPIHLLQGIAGGLLGPRAYEGGLVTAALGLFFQYFIAFVATAFFVVMSRRVRLLLEHAVLSDVSYGVGVYYFMQLVVLPLSAATKYPFSFELMVIGVVIHIFCVGLPISIAARLFLFN